MRNTRPLVCFACAISLLLLAACSINVKKEKNGEDKQVDINTLVGGIHVSNGANPEDVGIQIYPGARLKQKDSGDDKSANVNISGFGYGLKVVALEYESNDTPDKIIAFYRAQLKKYGNVIECHTGSLHVKAEVKKHDDGSHEVTCDGDGGKDIELKVGAEENQHIVAVEPSGSGASFSLVYVRTHGKDAEI
jgi:hypothetical protein